MKTIMLLGWRNIWRHKRRSLVVISSIAIGIFAIVASKGFMNGMNEQMIDNTINSSLGHVAIHAKGFQNNMKLELNFAPSDRIEASVRGSKNFVSMTRRVKIQGMVRSSESSQGVLVVGIDPVTEKKVSRIYEYTSKEGGGSFLEDPADDSILLSKLLAKKLDLQIGDKMVLMIQDKNNEIVGVGLKVRGFFASPIDSFDKFVVFMGIKRLQEITGLGDNISEINIITNDKNTVYSYKKHLIGKINDSNLEILTWMDMVPNLVSAIKLYDSMMFIFFMITFIVVIFSIANTMIMAIMERFHEIGVMKSIGTKPSMIFMMIVFEALNLGLVGLGAGVMLGILFIAITSFTGIDFSIYMESLKTWGTGSIIYPRLAFIDIAASIFIVFLTTVVAAIYPAVKAARIKPLEALNFI